MKYKSIGVKIVAPYSIFQSMTDEWQHLTLQVSYQERLLSSSLMNILLECVATN